MEPMESSPPSLLVTVRDLQGGVVVGLAGELSAHTTARMVREVGRILGRCLRPPQVVMDLSAVDFCDSSGLGGLVWVWKQAHEAGGRLVLSGAHGICWHLLHRTGVDRALAHYPRVTDAEAALAGAG